MRISRLHLVLMFLISVSALMAQNNTRKVVEVPKADASAITLDGQMNESEWQNAARADLITATSYEIWTNKYYRETLTEPDYDEFYARMLWSQDTLLLFIHIDEIVNDSTNLFWAGQWTGDQLFVSISNRLGVNMMGWYDGNVYAAPDGPYHYLILGDQVTLNMNDTTFVPEQYRKCQDLSDSLLIPNAADFAQWGITIDTINGVWNIEMKIYNPNIIDQALLGFNIGGSTGSRQAHEEFGDAYGYYTWQPSVPDEPYETPPIDDAQDPGFYNLANSEHWALLKFMGDGTEYVNKEVDVPSVNPSAITLDAKMDESVWAEAAQANLITSTSYEIWTNKYYRETLTEPDYDEFTARMLWSQDTLFLFVHIDEIVNDSTNLFWAGQWTGDQLFVSLSNRLSTNMLGWYDGNVYAAPDGPYHFLILGDQVTLNMNDTSFVPEQFRGSCLGDSLVVFNASDIAQWATAIDTVNGVWDVEMRIYNPGIASQGKIGFNIGGSTGSRQAHEEFGDAYGYFTWQPSVPDEPYETPAIDDAQDPGFYNLANSQYWALLNLVPGTTGVNYSKDNNATPSEFKLSNNYPNPFNPTTTFKIDLPKVSKVSIKIYNIVGQVVAELIDGEELTAGSYTFNWDAGQMASGVYFYQLQTDDFSSIKKMILLK